jgi:molybdopterin-guanine dinucleotide biosynthesis protein A
MGEDKSLLVYHGKPQYLHVYDMLQECCIETFISCNAKQTHLVNQNLETLADEETFANNGPATGVLTAFNTYPGRNFLVIACDYPLLTLTEIKHFVESIPAPSIAAAFYDEGEQCYHPVIAWYSAQAGSLLMKSPQLSLRQLLQHVNAYKHIPINKTSLTSVDTKEARERLTNINH